ncbi:Zn-dependent exopeptidase [Auricularia subglabra TFB-10046 SS5]|nr:Zn-dependent exopeptidase [Auricularia subglabra TFB-10046 SS5]
MFALKAFAILAVATCAIAQGQQPLTGASGINVNMLSAQQREAFMLELWGSMDVVDLMKMTGHGAGLDDERMVHVFGEDEPRTMTEGDKLRLKRQGKAFIDITEHPDLGALNAHRASLRRVKAPRVLEMSLDDAERSRVRKAIEVLDEQHLRDDIAVLSGFWNRNYRSEWGRRSSHWVFEHVQGILDTKKSDSKLRTSVRKFPHRFPQSSVVARLEAADDDTEAKQLIIIGAHQDSLNYWMPFYRAPGADDDGSGSVTIMQVLRSVIEHEFVPPAGLAVEFHWYAAEEGGLLGSQDIAAAYEKDAVQVKGMLQMDMTAWQKKGTTPIIAFFKDVVDMDLTDFAAKLVEQYTPLPWNLTSCGSTCGSDHMSWTRAGYPAIFATEALFEDFQPQVHTPYDDLSDEEQYSYKHMLEFVKLGIAFITELAAA